MSDNYLGIFLGIDIIVPKVFEDYRGSYRETYNEKDYSEHNRCPHFVTDAISVSRKNTIRGFHGDFVTWKLVQCLKGCIYERVIDLRKDSDTFGKVFSIILSEYNHKMILIPPGCGNSFLALSDEIVYHYKQSEYYEGKQFTLKYDAVDGWPIDSSQVILSERDMVGIEKLSSFKKEMKKRGDLRNNPYYAVRKIIHTVHDGTGSNKV
jgi:dTDP-4-dehydrorhamnose 3,5-epimerase